MRQMIKNIMLVIVFVTSISVACLASTLNNSEAVKAYNNSDFSKSIELFKKEISKNGESSELLYNIGNCYYNENDFGHAVVYYKRALRLDASNSKAKNNLNYTLSLVNDKNTAELKGKPGNVVPDAPDFFNNIYNTIAIDVASNTWAVIGAIFFILLIVGIAIYVFVSDVLMRKIGFFGGIISLILSISAIIFAFIGRSEYNKHDDAVVTTDSVSLKNDNKDTASDISTPLHSGTILQILEHYTDVNDEEWLKVKLNSEHVGWIKSAEVEII